METLNSPNPNPSSTGKMKAIVQDDYGSPDVLRLEDIDKPVLQDNEARVRVYASDRKSTRLNSSH